MIEQLLSISGDELAAYFWMGVGGCFVVVGGLLLLRTAIRQEF